MFQGADSVVTTNLLASASENGFWMTWQPKDFANARTSSVREPVMIYLYLAGSLQPRSDCIRINSAPVIPGMF